MDLTSTQQVAFSLLFTLDNGHTSTTDPVAGDIPAWANDNPTVGTLTVATDGNTANFVALAAAGTANITVKSADNAGGTVNADPLVINVTVAAFKVTSVQIVPGPITPQ